MGTEQDGGTGVGEGLKAKSRRASRICPEKPHDTEQWPVPFPSAAKGSLAPESETWIPNLLCDFRQGALMSLDLSVLVFEWRCAQGHVTAI